jgi:hypothetical protein
MGIEATTTKADPDSDPDPDENAIAEAENPISAPHTRLVYNRSVIAFSYISILFPASLAH